MAPGVDIPYEVNVAMAARHANAVHRVFPALMTGWRGRVSYTIQECRRVTLPTAGVRYAAFFCDQGQPHLITL
jgi:hypothetical protein